MPSSPARACRQPGCPFTTADRCGRCRAREREYERERGSAAKRGYGRWWQRESKRFLAENPWCAWPGCMKLATEVDHIVPVTGPDDPLFRDKSNWQSLCHEDHSYKTAVHDGRFTGSVRRNSLGNSGRAGKTNMPMSYG